ncbi:autotransporter domain-containing protein [Yoonia sp.]|nr:autotransporter domain-containing protein [Yoonia sp.]
MIRSESSALGATLLSLLLTSTAQAQPLPDYCTGSDIVIDVPTTDTNGGCPDLDGDDRIIVTDEGSIVVMANGLKAEGNNNTLTNNGVISTMGYSHFGIYINANGLNASGNTLVNNGMISTTGVFAEGMYVRELLTTTGNTLINNGTITTTGDDAEGMSSDGGNSILTNTGTIATLGARANAMSALQFQSGPDNDFNTLTNSGIITTNGVGAYGIFVNGASNTLNNSGTILSEQSDSVRMVGNDVILNLLQGSVLYGDVHFNNPDTATLNFGSGLNAIVRANDLLDTTITAPNDQYVVAGQTVYVFDSGFVGVSEQAIGGVTSLMLDSLGQQMSYGIIVPAVTQGVAGTQREGWGQVFGTERSADGSVGDSTTAGFMVGADLDDVRGLFLGFARSTQEVDASNELESDNFFAGYYANYTLNGLNVDASLTAGMATNSTERSVANNTVVGGLETATAEYNSYYLMPAATFSGDITVGSGSLIPSVRVSYAAIRDQAYTETGSAANLDVAPRTSHLFGTRVQLDRGLSGYAIGSGMLLANFRAGFDGQYAKGGGVTATLLGQSFELQASNDETSGRGFAGVDLRHVSDDQSHELYGSLEVGRSSTDVTDVSVNLGAVFRF